MEAGNKKNNLLSFGIRKKIIGVLIITLLFCFLGVKLLIIPSIIDKVHKDQMNKMTLAAEGIVSQIKKKMLEGKAKSVDSLIESFNDISSVQKVIILEPNGKAAFRNLSTLNEVNKRLGENRFQREERPDEVILPQNDPLLQEVLSAKSPVSFLSDDSESRILLFPLLNEDKCHECHRADEKIHGIVFIRKSILQDKETIKYVELELIIGFFAVLLIVTLSLWLALKKIIVAPILKLAEGSRLIATEGFKSRSIEINSKDEIGELASNLNRMVASLNEQYLKIKDTEEFLRSVLENMGGGMSVLDREFRVLLTNRTVLNFMKMEAKDVIGKHCYKVFHKLDHVCPDCAVAKTFETGKPAFTSHSASTSDGSEVHGELYSYPITDSEGRVVKVIEMVTDITARVKMEEQLRRSEKLAAVGLLAGGIAHEVGNPLASIYSLAQIIERKTQEPFTLEKIEMMKTSIERITKIIQDFLDFQKPHTSNHEDVNLPDVIESSIRLVRHDERAARLSVSTRFENSLPPVYASADGLHQVFINLIFNAADAVKENEDGRLIISASRNNGFITVAFNDNGRGMSEDEREKLFEPFFTTKEVGKGTGLGLFVSYGIIKSFGGDIEVESEKGRGSSFKLHLPVAKDKN